ncbi:response regulator [Candidatus Saccharibacteria bacterium]|nr:response regulator [Candidatus Saccharibacteria bacterium]
MTKIMLVEDDKSLREIYSIRLVAEGYEVVSAGDGEEALAMAVQQRPDLILSDVMMPKISGFDMLDILRSTPETKDIKVIMMTALSSEDQRERGENLGANKYLVKSQVGIEDVVNAVHEVLGDKEAAGTANSAQTGDATTPTIAGPMGAQPEVPTVQVGTGVEGTQSSDAQSADTSATNTQAPAAQPDNAQTPVAQPDDAQVAGSQPQNATAAAMDELLNNTPDTTNATWPGNTSQ